MSTSLAVLALAGFMAIPVPSPAPKPIWWRDYQIAQTKGAETRKPLAVFVGSGPGGYQALTKEGELSDSVNKVLKESYVCVYLDTDTPSHAELIKQLAVTKGRGLVISDRSGGVQAFHHDGQMPTSDLSEQLQHFADLKVEVTTTVSNANTRSSYYSGTSSLRESHYAPATSVRTC
jgi:hypothetical protein